MSETALDLARALISCPSVTPQDGGTLGVLESRLKASGFRTHRLTFHEEGTPDIDNLYARFGSGAPCLVFAGHTDVVPVGTATDWRFDPFAAKVEDGQLWGRGAADMKGAIAAFTAAALTFIEQHKDFKGSIAFLITGDEEGPSINGTIKLLKWAAEQGEHFDHCIVGEPTNPQVLGDMIKIGRRGSLNGILSITGKQGHVAYPHRADNPVPKLMRLIEALIGTPLDEGTDHFDASNLEVVALSSGTDAYNVIPAKAEARFNIRFNDLWTPQTLELELLARLDSVAEGTAYTLTFEPCNALAFITKPDQFTDLVANAIEKQTGRRPELSTTGGTSDARFISAYCPVVEFGLVGQTMHMVDERVSVADIATLETIYTSILEGYFP
ncbi:succinyl-diaminopimelate desuccinylase [Beijerinckia indica]|uniref:Succinyl-diaminopimelate desuccinylase n=1 Tax=Beijerinckia indica subsp. indica (strain ATCC 9039 / DSM 1715 / NCIMB 8712) TaxID=395963 RepID=DAPE_BEII9|nr:succinyl-diaminopimelate desuccinylase [Beijerinckia indica]B2IDW3.1 RecName: Full=Succinyl-diaminopimelate desuccinylase; Short=SDAP desuccinylase; AltName: Full=N-succinyl-LL-2,6-diaminoheptanedioate amidohydrolase [Beijerinckia indica subsp. indica ATCC 9039]ACB96895.1 succinyl-diaminopimelate desuccinylase [Beijerinckia indica subsp. indica ATCC 9039]